MKIRISPALSVLAALLACTVSQAPAEVIGTPEGALLEIAPGPPPVSASNPVRTTLYATILPMERGSQARGELVFTPGGDQVLVLGRIDGLETNRRYQWILLPAGATVPVTAAPAAGVTGRRARPAGEDLGMLISDARGVVVVHTLLPRILLAKFPDGLVGGLVVIKRAPPLDPPAARPAVAGGRIIQPAE